MEALLVCSLHKLEAPFNYFVSISHSELMYFWPESIATYFIIIDLSIFGFWEIMNKLMYCVVFSRCWYISYSIINRTIPVTSISATSITFFKGFKYLGIGFILSHTPYLYKLIIITFRNPIKTTSCMSIPSEWASNYIWTFYKLSLIKEYIFMLFWITWSIILYIYSWINIS